MNCKFCKKSLIALNLSDIEDNCCQECEQKILSKINTIEEDDEIKNLSDRDLSVISKTLYPTPISMTRDLNWIRTYKKWR